MPKKRIRMPYWTQHEEDEYSDPEKQHLPYDFSQEYSANPSPQSSPTPSTPSSRITSDPQEPMLKLSQPRRTLSHAYSYHNSKFARLFSRYFALTIGSILVLFILALIYMSHRSSLQIIGGALGRPQPPPVWESFPFLKRYHGGIRTLVPRAENKPEYPSVDDEIPVAPFKLAASAEASKAERRDGLLQGVPSSEPFIPYPSYNSDEYRSEFGPVVECFLDAKGTQRIPRLQAYNGVPHGMPENVVGSYGLLGLRDDICFDRFGKLGPYGLGYSRKLGGSGAGMDGDKDGARNVWANDPEVDYRQVNWTEAQERCLKMNDNRFRTRLQKGQFIPRSQTSTTEADDITPLEKRRQLTPEDIGPNWASMPPRPDRPKHSPLAQPASQLVSSPASLSSENPLSNAPSLPSVKSESLGSHAELAAPPKANSSLPRTAVLIRTWSDYPYDDEDLFYLRSLVAELSLMSGGEYTIHFLIHVKDDNLRIWADEDIYQRVLNDSLPQEFRGMGTLWSERQMGLIYGGLEESFYRGLPVHGVYRSTFMPVQFFAHKHPEYDYIWNWEMDARYTGHYYHLFDRVVKWAKQQPRKGLWERNARFYVPSEHGSWDDFKHMVRVQTEQGTGNNNNIWGGLAKNPNVPEDLKTQHLLEKPIWGPEPPSQDEIELDPALQPPTSYAKDNYEWGVGEEADLITFNPLFDPENTGWILAEDVTGYKTTNVTAGIYPPRRTAIITACRLSRRMLETMHRETALKRHTMFSEMWPGSVALHHGLKAVYVPHPMYIDRRWPTSYLASVFNGGKNGASGGARTSPFSDDRQHNFLGVSWYYHAGAPVNLWKRWLGYRVNGDGGEEEEMAGEGRMCLPAMLLHPVKQVDLIYEHREGD